MHKVKAKQSFKQATGGNASPISTAPTQAPAGQEVTVLDLEDTTTTAILTTNNNNSSSTTNTAAPSSVATTASKNNKALFRFMERMKLTSRTFFCDGVSARLYLTNTVQPHLGPTSSVTSLIATLSESGGVIAADTGFYDNDEDAANEVLLRAEKRDQDGSILPVDATVRAAAKRRQEENMIRRELWNRLCMTEYIKRQEQFRRKATGGSGSANVSDAYSAYISRMRWAGLFLVIIACAVAYGWPLWDQLLDVESDGHLETLGLGRSSTKEDIKKAYRKLSKEYHPDLNADCENIDCREKLMRVQEAYDNLIARGVGLDEQYQKELHQYKEALQELRSLIFFRAYGIAVHCAEFVNLIVIGSLSALIGAVNRNRAVRSTIEKAIQAFVVVAFISAEIMLAGGVNVITILIQLFSLCANMLQTNAIKQQQRRIVKWSNFDWAKDAVFFVLPAVLFQIVQFCVWEKFPRTTEYILRTVLGVAFLGAHLARYSPNLFDNMSLRKCSIPMPYLSLVGAAHQFRNPTYVFQKRNFVQAELLLILDDLFAFTLQVPHIFRAIVFVVHGLFLVQMYLLPWDSPVTSRLQQRFLNQKSDDELDGNTTNDASGQYLQDGAGGRDAMVGAARKGSLLRVRGSGAAPPSATLSDKERLWLVDLDREQPKWVEVPQIKYSSALRRHGGNPSAAQQQQQQTQFLLAVTPNLEEVLIASVKAVKSNSKFQEFQEMASSQRPTVQIVERHRDPLGVEYLVREQGNSVIIPNSNNAQNTRPGHLPIGEEEKLQAFMTEMMMGDAQPYEREGARTVGENSSLPKERPSMCAEGADETSVMKFRKFGGVQGFQNLTISQMKNISLLGQRTLRPSASSEYFEADKAVKLLPGNTRQSTTALKSILAHNLTLVGLLLFGLLTMFLSPLVGEGTNRQARGPAAAASSFQPFLTPIASQKFQGLLPSNHELNRFAAGAIVLPPIAAYDIKLPIPVLLPDLFDSLRQLALFESLTPRQQQQQQQQTREPEPESFQQQHHQGQYQHHQQQHQGQKRAGSKKSGGRKKGAARS